MTSLPEAVRRLEPARARSMAAALAPYLTRPGTYPTRYVEEAALTVLASVYPQAGRRASSWPPSGPGSSASSISYRAPERQGP
ncbi:MAG: hypothetical protein U0838_04295 [Chloroflexota bacterium]